MKLVGLVGSLRRRSYNRALAGATAELAPAETEFQVHGIEGIPVYDADLEAEQGIPQAVTRLKEAVAASDGLLVATPEYNNAMPGPLKNAIDWMTRPPKDISRVFHGLPVGVVGASPGPGGTRLSQTEWLPVWRTLQTRPFFEQSVYLARAGNLFDNELRLSDEETREQLRRYVEAFVTFCAQQPRR